MLSQLIVRSFKLEPRVELVGGEVGQ